MKIVRFKYANNIKWGILDSDKEIRPLQSSPFEKIGLSKDKINLDKIKLLAPVTPSKIILAGLNYIAHAKELNMDIPENPIIFLKPPTSVIGPGDNIVYPDKVQRVDYEAELAVVVKDKVRHISKEKADKHILGYTCLNDVTARNVQKKEGQWTRAKSYDTFCPIGPWIETEFDPSNIKVQSYLNGELKQTASTQDFIFSVPELVSFISRIMTLNPGDVISTGTPAGTGEMKAGDQVEIVIENIGRLKNRVIYSPKQPSPESSRS